MSGSRFGLIVVGLIWTIFSSPVFLAAASSEIYFGYDEEVELSASDFGLTDFPAKVDVVGSHTVGDQVKELKFKVLENTGDTLSVVWKKAVPLYDKKAVKKKLLSGIENLSEDMVLDSVKAGDALLTKTAYLVNPFLMNITKSDEQTDVYSVRAKFLGGHKPKIMIESLKGETPRYKPCKISGFQVEDGVYSFDFVYPKLKDGDEATGYFVLQNKVGYCVKRADVAEDELEEIFLEAVEDSSVREFDEICENLKALSPDNPDAEIIWDDSKERVKLLVWTGSWWDEEKAKPGATIYNFSPANDEQLGWFMYVTSYGEAVEFMKDAKFALNSERNNRLRLAQKLGLHIEDGITDQKLRFLVLWAEPSSLFRPSPDPEVNDSQAVMALRYGQISVDNAWATKHYDWKRENSYDPDGAPQNAYPFTGFGYTYDWGDPSTDVGLSEFTVLPESPVEVIDNISTAEFFDTITLK